MADGISGASDLSSEGKYPKLKIKEGKLVLEFTCPRCGTEQEREVDPEKLICGDVEIHCGNRELCGDERNMTISLYGIQVGGYYQDTGDVPLGPPRG